MHRHRLTGDSSAHTSENKSWRSLKMEEATPFTSACQPKSLRLHESPTISLKSGELLAGSP